METVATRFTVCAAFAGVFLALAPARADILIKSGEKIAFFGGSITAGGWSNPAGHLHMVVAGLEANGVKVEAVPAGVSGDKSNQMLERLERDVLSKKPQWMTVSCGLNDVWMGKYGVPLDEEQAKARTYEKRDPKEPEKGTYRKNITQIVERAQAAGVKPVILTSTIIKEELDSPENKALAPYNAFLRDFAKEKKLPIADLNTMFRERIKAAKTPGKNDLTADGMHLNNDGNELMAIGILKVFGLDAEQLKKAEESWIPLHKAAEAAARANAAEAAEKKATEAPKATPVPAAK